MTGKLKKSRIHLSGMQRTDLYNWLKANAETVAQQTIPQTFVKANKELVIDDLNEGHVKRAIVESKLPFVPTRVRAKPLEPDDPLAAIQKQLNRQSDKMFALYTVTESIMTEFGMHNMARETVQKAFGRL